MKRAAKLRREYGKPRLRVVFHWNRMNLQRDIKTIIEKNFGNSMTVILKWR
jgi:hypothetical protein